MSVGDIIARSACPRERIRNTLSYQSSLRVILACLEGVRSHFDPLGQVAGYFWVQWWRHVIYSKTCSVWHFERSFLQIYFEESLYTL